MSVVIMSEVNKILGGTKDGIPFTQNNITYVLQHFDENGVRKAR
jgi:hypothetical protein